MIVGESTKEVFCFDDIDENADNNVDDVAKLLSERDSRLQGLPVCFDNQNNEKRHDEFVLNKEKLQQFEMNSAIHYDCDYYLLEISIEYFRDHRQVLTTDSKPWSASKLRQLGQDENPLFRLKDFSQVCHVPYLVCLLYTSPSPRDRG